MADLKMTNADLWNALVSGKPDVVGPLAELVDLDTPCETSSLLRRSLRLAGEAFGDLEKGRAKLIAKFVTKTTGADGKEVEVIDPKFHEEFQKLMSVKVSLAGCVAVKVKDLGNVAFSGKKLELLKKFVVEDAA